MACISMMIVCVTTPHEFPAGRSCRLVTEVAPASVLHVENMGHGKVKIACVA